LAELGRCSFDRIPRRTTELETTLPDEIWKLLLDYPIRPDARYGYGRPAHPELACLIERGRSEYERMLDCCLQLADWFRRIPVLPLNNEEADPYWSCGWLSPLDLAVLYATIVESGGRRYVEVGSGYSTLFARQAIVDHGLDVEIVSIDPEPRAAVEAACDVSVRRALEDADLDVFAELEAGDVLFIDGSHRCFTNSDVTVAFLEILPRLPAGVIVGIDDVYLPYDYPPAWRDRYYSEQYVLAAWLLGGARVTLTSANAFIAADDALMAMAAPLWGEGPFGDLVRDGNCFWFVTR
jgi:predicted O-methyltransferase YrrM